MKKSLLLFLILFLAISCESPETDQEKQPPSGQSLAEEVVQKAIEHQGGDKIRSSTISFTFRGRSYKSTREGGSFTYERIFTDSTGQKFHDVLTNEGLTRSIDGQIVSLSIKDSSAYANSVNSVIYFALLPYFLNDQSVNKEYIGKVTIKGEPYHKVSVTFDQEGGGKDYEDEYVYWIHEEKNSMDYLAYNYQTDGGGARFRSPYNQRRINGVLFQDYINYKPIEKSMEVKTFDKLYENNGLKELSRIELEEVELLLSQQVGD